jgi:hypothetical protein
MNRVTQARTTTMKDQLKRPTRATPIFSNATSQQRPHSISLSGPHTTRINSQQIRRSWSWKSTTCTFVRSGAVSWRNTKLCGERQPLRAITFLIQNFLSRVRIFCGRKGYFLSSCRMLSLLFRDECSSRLIPGGVKDSGIGRYFYNSISRLSNSNVLTLDYSVHRSVGGFRLEESHWLSKRLRLRHMSWRYAAFSFLHGENDGVTTSLLRWRASSA